MACNARRMLLHFILFDAYLDSSLLSHNIGNLISETMDQPLGVFCHGPGNLSNSLDAVLSAGLHCHRMCCSSQHFLLKCSMRSGCKSPHTPAVIHLLALICSSVAHCWCCVDFVISLVVNASFSAENERQTNLSLSFRSLATRKLGRSLYLRRQNRALLSTGI